MGPRRARHPRGQQRQTHTAIALTQLRREDFARLGHDQRHPAPDGSGSHTWAPARARAGGDAMNRTILFLGVALTTLLPLHALAQGDAVPSVPPPPGGWNPP